MHLQDAYRDGRLADEAKWLRRYPLVVSDEVGYIPVQPEGTNLLVQLVSSRYKHAFIILATVSVSLPSCCKEGYEYQHIQAWPTCHSSKSDRISAIVDASGPVGPGHQMVQSRHEGPPATFRRTHRRRCSPDRAPRNPRPANNRPIRIPSIRQGRRRSAVEGSDHYLVMDNA